MTDTRGTFQLIDRKKKNRQRHGRKRKRQADK